MMRAVGAAVAGIVFLSSIVVANVLTARHGMVGVGFGLTATAGTYAAGFAFIARDALHELTDRPRFYSAAYVVVGAAIAYHLSLPQLAIASGVAFAVSELLDLLVYERLRSRGIAVSSTSSNFVGAIVDTLVFVPLAGFALTWEVGAGQVVGKLAVTGATLIVWLLVLALFRRARAVPL